MPKKKNAEPATDQVAWIKHLPEGGGVWGASLVQTVEAMEADLAPKRKQFEELSEDIVARESIVKDAVKRADREAKGLFNDKQIATAKKAAEKAREKATESDEPEVTVGDGASTKKSQPRA